MAVQLNISYETLVQLVEQLPAEQQNALLTLLSNRQERPELTADEKIARLRAAQIHNAVKQEPSPRRADWYGDDGR